MAVSKVDFVRNGIKETLVDLTGDTVTADTLLQGVTATDAKGEKVVGTAVIPTKLSELTDDVGYVKDSGGTLNGGYSFKLIPNMGLHIGMTTDSSRLMLGGGTSYLNGATLRLFGKDHAQYPGYAYIFATGETEESSLQLRPDGYFSAGGVPSSQFAAPDTSTFANLTLPSSGGTVTAPGDGYISLLITSTASGQYIRLDNGVGIHQTCCSSGTGQPLSVYVPVSQGDTVTVRYSTSLASSSTIWFRFVKNKGAV